MTSTKKCRCFFKLQGWFTLADGSLEGLRPASEPNLSFTETQPKDAWFLTKNWSLTSLLRLLMTYFYQLLEFIGDSE